jgi:hypothetical protein
MAWGAFAGARGSTCSLAKVLRTPFSCAPTTAGERAAPSRSGSARVRARGGRAEGALPTNPAGWRPLDAIAPQASPPPLSPAPPLPQPLPPSAARGCRASSWPRGASERADRAPGRAQRAPPWEAAGGAPSPAPAADGPRGPAIACHITGRGAPSDAAATSPGCGRESGPRSLRLKARQMALSWPASAQKRSHCPPPRPLVHGPRCVDGGTVESVGPDAADVPLLAGRGRTTRRAATTQAAARRICPQTPPP